MDTYMENQAETRQRRTDTKSKVAIQILKDYAGERVTMGQVDKTFCQGYIDYLSDGISSARAKHVSKFTAQNYYRVLNGALNAAVRADVIKLNPFTKIGNSDKIRPSRKQKGVYDYRGASGIDRHPDEERGGKTGLSVLLLLRTADKRYNQLEMGQTSMRR